jgi:hypothetical protein
MASADGAKSVNDFIRRIALSSYKHSSSSTLAKGEAIVVDESARRALGDESVMEAGKHACASKKVTRRYDVKGHFQFILLFRGLTSRVF